jgi:AraC-like DNA-binding protein
MWSIMSGMSRGGLEQRRQADAPPRGILGVPGRLPFDVRRWPPPADLAWCIERFWMSAWDLPAGRSYVTRILPHPSVNVTLEAEGLRVTGIASGVWSRRLSGTERAFGVKFQPGAFRLFTDVPVASISGAGQAALGVLPGADALEQELRSAADDDERAAVAGAYVRARGVEPTPTLELVQAAVALLVGDGGVRRVGDAGQRLGVTQRTLQRLFAEYVGVSPGWVLRRGRLHAAAERVIQLAASGPEESLAAVAAEFGYADQAHFSRDFRRMLGTSPGDWAASLATEVLRVGQSAGD